MVHGDSLHIITCPTSRESGYSPGQYTMGKAYEGDGSIDLRVDRSTKLM